MPDPIALEEIAAPINAGTPPPRLWPVATVMATGIFATTFVQLQGLGYLPFNHLLKQMGMDSDKAATFFSLSMLPWSLKVIAGLLVDSVPLFGSRRRMYLLLSALSAMIMWLAMAFSPGNYAILLVLAIGMNAAVVLGSTASGGLLVEAGQMFGASGRLSSLRVFAQNLGAGLGIPLGGLLAAHALGWTSAAAIMPLSCMFFAAWFLFKEPKLPQESRPQGNFMAESWRVARSFGRQTRNVLRWDILVPVLLVFFIQAVPTFRSTCFYQYQTGPLKYSDAALGWLGLAGYGVALLSSGVYALCCRKIPLRTSLYGAIILTYLSAIPYLYYTPYTPYMPRAVAIEGLGTFLQYLAYLPLFDLIVRSTPKGSEALGYSLLISVWNVGLMIGTKTGPTLYEHWLNEDMNSLIWLNAGVTLAGIVLVFLLPKKFVDQSEGKPFAPAEPAVPPPTPPN